MGTGACTADACVHVSGMMCVSEARHTVRAHDKQVSWNSGERESSHTAV